MTPVDEQLTCAGATVNPGPRTRPGPRPAKQRLGEVPDVDQPTAEQLEVADVIRRALADFDLPPEHVPLAAAGNVLGRPWIADALATRGELAELRHTVDMLRMRHTAVPIRPGHDHQVCAACRREWPCPDGAVLWGLA